MATNFECADSNFQQPHAKKKRLSTKKQTGESSSSVPRFAIMSTTDELNSSKKQLTTKNTKKSTMWAVRAFAAWIQERNSIASDKCPVYVLTTNDNKLLCHWLCVFVTEVRKSDGSEYTPRSISQLLSGLQRHINSKKEPREPILCFSDPENGQFRELHNVLERRYKALHEQGISATVGKARVITQDEENQLWTSGVLGPHNPSSLLNAMFYYNGLFFVLRGGQEHRNLKLSQIVVKSVPNPEKLSEMIDVVEYTEHGSKNRPGGKHQLNLTNKRVTHFDEGQFSCAFIHAYRVFRERHNLIVVAK